MDPRLQQAAESGNIDELYAVINEDPYILDKIDAVPFVNTPLHVAATCGNREFAMEMMNLKPSFAKKLNTSGYCPLHLAVCNDRSDFVSWMVWLDGGLASVKGRNGITPFLLLVSIGDAHFVAECLLSTPNCIKDVSVNNQNALHLAVMNDRFEVLQVLTGWIQRMSQKNADLIEDSVLNYRDFNHNTPLHLAAIKNDHQAIRVLLECRLMGRNKRNVNGFTFLDILKHNGQNATGLNATGADLDLEKVISKTGCKEAVSVPKSMTRSDFLKSSITFVAYCSTQVRRLRSNTSDEARGVFLIVCALIITSTYQTALQPPGGVHQSDNADANAGSVVMKQIFFIFLWLSNTLGFCCAIFYTYCLIPLDSVFETWYSWVGTSLCLSYALAMAIISPHPLLFLSATFAFFLLFALILMQNLIIFWREYNATVSFKPRLSWFGRINTKLL